VELVIHPHHQRLQRAPSEIQSAIEQGRLILGQFTMKVNTRPFPGINMVEGHRDTGKRSARRRLDFSFNVKMKGEKKYITKEQVRHVRYQRPLSVHLLKKYEY
jgi:hypothetical protein